MKEFDFINQFVGKAASADGKSGGTNPDLPAHEDEILVIDDDELIRKLMQRLIQREFDVDIKSFANGIEGLEYAKEHVPNLIILDLMLPGMNGFEILKEIRDTPELKHIKVVMISAKSRSEDIETGFNLSADEYITKPFKPQELKARLKKLLKSTG